MPLRHEAVIFDLFGTLVSGFWEGHDDHLAEMAAELGVPREDFARAWGATCEKRLIGEIPTIAENLRLILEELGLHPDEERIETAVKMRENFVRARLTPRPEAGRILREIKANGLKLGLMSDCSPEVPPLWDELPISRYFDCAVFSSSVHMRKPDPRMYLLACKRLEVEPESCLYVGDGGHSELTGARKLGMLAILIQSSDEQAPEPFATEAGTWDGPRISSLERILGFIS